MMSPLRLRFFAHSWRSDWNHGNAHFLRGLVDELAKLGHQVRCYEANDSWSFLNLLREPDAAKSLQEFRDAFPDLDIRNYSLTEILEFGEKELHDADVVVIHEWTPPEIADAIVSLKHRFGFRVLFHDTHHRSYTNPEQIGQFPLSEIDGVLAFGEAIHRIYLEHFRVARAWTFHEAADTARFFPRSAEEQSELNWIGNWGDEERTRELQEFLIGPLASFEHNQGAVYGVRYPEEAQAMLKQAGIQYRGYLPNLSAPSVYSKSALTLHIPRRCYANGLSGIPTIRMFEAFACGVPLVCSPWNDTEGLFRPNEDYLCVPSGEAMTWTINFLLKDELARRQLAIHALETIQQRNTCAHRAREFEQICEELGK